MQEQNSSQQYMYISKRWATVAEKIPGRIGKQCRERWKNYLDPSVQRGDFSQEEHDIISRERKAKKPWIEIAWQLPGRTDNLIKNYWNTVTGKRRKRAKPLMGSVAAH